MGRFKKIKENSVPALNTASLPDIIFMLLFFFMVTTTLKKTNILVQIRQPRASEAEKLEKKSLVHFIYIGAPTDAAYGSVPRIQINDAFAEVSDVAGYIEAEKSGTPEQDWGKMTTSLKIDKDARMGMVTDVKQELRKANALNINYSAKK